MKIHRRYSGDGSFDEESGYICGYAIVFNSTTVLFESGGTKYTEEIDSAACDKALARADDVRCLLNHDPNRVFGRTKNGTLKLWKDDKGLAFKCKYDDSISWHRDAVAQVKRGDIDQCSFAFTVDEIETVRTKGEEHDIIKDLHLYDVSIVTYPAYEDTECWSRCKTGEVGETERRRNDPEVLAAEITLI